MSRADILVLQAGNAGAFLLPTTLTGFSSPVPADRSRSAAELSLPPVLSDESLAGSLAALCAANRGIGILLDRGRRPEVARQGLERRAHDGDVTIAVLGRLLLDSVCPTQPCGH